MNIIGGYSVVLDSRQATYDRITTEVRSGSYRLHSDSSNITHAPGLGAAIYDLIQKPVDTLFVHSLDCDENKLVEAFRNVPPSKLPSNVVVYGAYPNISERFTYLLSTAFGREMRVSTLKGDI